MTLILGIDEVGRGAWAGPLAVGAVVFDSSVTPNGLADSKKLTKHQRENLIGDIKQSALAVGIGWIDAAVIDQIGLSRALKVATENAFAQISPDIQTQLDQIIIDGTINLLNNAPPNVHEKVTTLIKADAKIAAVSAAAIVAKVTRDHYMTQLAQVFPDFHFAAHVGYGTAAHLAELQKFGALDGIHRQSFAPISKLACHSKLDLESSKRRVAIGDALSDWIPGQARNDVRGDKISKTAGRIAENIAAEFLKTKGHQIIARNWRTKFCEIDIISACNQTIFFTEVKFRENAKHGDGLDAITPKKLAQMRRAAEIFLTTRAEFTNNFNPQISAISLCNNPPEVDNYLECII